MVHHCKWRNCRHSAIVNTQKWQITLFNRLDLFSLLSSFYSLVRVRYIYHHLYQHLTKTIIKLKVNMLLKQWPHTNQHIKPDLLNGTGKRLKWNKTVFTEHRLESLINTFCKQAQPTYLSLVTNTSTSRYSQQSNVTLFYKTVKRWHSCFPTSKPVKCGFVDKANCVL